MLEARRCLENLDRERRAHGCAPAGQQTLYVSGAAPSLPSFLVCTPSSAVRRAGAQDGELLQCSTGFGLEHRAFVPIHLQLDALVRKMELPGYREKTPEEVKKAGK